ncbi:MAG: multiheme c-type cytochrome [Flavobacteriaceae bacterium]
MECHASIYATHLKTAHFNTSSLPTEKSILGSFEAGKNTLELQEALFTMVSEKGAFYEHARSKFAKDQETTSKFDIVIGSGVKGQSYLTWENDMLYQLQASYYTNTDSWINSPNFPESITKRSVNDACLKCHVTFAENIEATGNSNQYVREHLVLGIDCERCHGPAQKHVLHHRNNPQDTVVGYMLNLKALSRQKRLDICIQCHSGLRARQVKGNPFSFVAGEDLATYSQNFYTGRPENELDVHGNQYGLLKSSKCFQASPTMDCATCHDPHSNQRGDINVFNQKCIGCHSKAQLVCSIEPSQTANMGQDCIACHMPLSPSKSMTVKPNADGVAIPVYIRSHLIAVYDSIPKNIE